MFSEFMLLDCELDCELHKYFLVFFLVLMGVASCWLW